MFKDEIQEIEPASYLKTDLKVWLFSYLFWAALRRSTSAKCSSWAVKDKRK